MSDAAVLHIHDVLNQAPLDHLHGGRIDAPLANTHYGSFDFLLNGWALGRTSPVEHIEVVLREGRSVLSLPLSRPRADIAEAFPAAAGEAPTGFQARIGVLDLPRDFDIAIRVALVSGKRVPMGRIRGTREPLELTSKGRIAPLLVSTIGRSGSTWLVWLLSQHPEVVAFRPFDSDARIATYWMSVLQDLSQPKSYGQQLSPRDVQPSHWWLGDGEAAGREIPGAGVADWLGREAVEDLAVLCRSRIDAFYEALAGERSRYFVEKVHPWRAIPDLLAEVHPETHELVLVRDFRDVLCSIVAFNRKRGYAAFGRDASSSDEEYVASTLRRSAEALLDRCARAGSRAHVVRYEDLVRQPRQTLVHLLGELELDNGEPIVEAMLASAEEAGPSMDYHRTATDAASSVGRWEHDLPPDLIAFCERELGEVLEAFGYGSEVPVGVRGR